MSMDLGLQKGYNSGQDKHNSAAYTEDDELCNRRLKLPKSEESSAVMKQYNNPVFSSEGLQMLSFSGTEKLSTLPFLYNTSGSNYHPNIAGSFGCVAASENVHEIFNGVRGPFTPSQWMELEHQALIYKHITSNMPVPSTLLMPIRRALSHAALSHYAAQHYTPMAWGGFHLGLPSSNDPEPGRCRRTDGKKWRCSRDAVADQKYCERHINRGRHRSRKPVEGQQLRYSVANASSPNLTPTPNIPAAVDPNGCGSSSLKISLNENFHLETSGPSESENKNRVFMSKDVEGGRGQVDSQDISVPPSSIFQNLHYQESSYGQSFRSDFGFVTSDNLHNTPTQDPPYENCKQFRPHSIPTHQFINDSLNNQPDQTPTTWPSMSETELSISIHSHTKTNLSPSTPVWEFHPNPMGLGGPLGEVLQNSSVTNNTESQMSSGLNLFTSSPTGVLQKDATFPSRTSSSAGSSPHAETNMPSPFTYL